MRDRNERKLAKKKFRQAMKDEILSKAPGMKFVLDMGEEGARLTPRVIHALGSNFKHAYCSWCIFLQTCTKKKTISMEKKRVLLQGFTYR